MKGKRRLLLEDAKRQRGKVNQERDMRKGGDRIGKDKEKHHHGDGYEGHQCMWIDRSQVWPGSRVC